MNHGRLHWYEPAELDEGQKALYDEIVGGPRAGQANIAVLTDNDGRLQGPFNAFLLDPVLGEAVQALGAAIRYRTRLSDRLREIAILAVACSERSNFEWDAHHAIGKSVGITDEELAALGAGADAESFDDEDRLVSKLTRALVRGGDLDDALFAEAVAALGEAQLFDLIVLVGHYEMLARSLRVWRTPIPAGAVPRFPTS
ncbi:MAG TPA: carboxymuconolactone decarboxylase family protein [Acidimicrobiales bacterium]|nr:carboxymuconolactone decarboxylase family protein [Acidimicrobiales bacterium]